MRDSCASATTFLGTAVSRYDIDELDDYGKKPRESQQKAVEVRRPDGSVAKSRGERTFYGAFTGGFSAGYWNTVGSKEGWEPATFSSSRSKRSQTTALQVEDYMDEEDRREHQASHQSVQPRACFAQQEASKDRHEMALSGLVGDVKKHVFGKREDRLGARLLAAASATAATAKDPQAPGSQAEASEVGAPAPCLSAPSASSTSSSSSGRKKRYGCAPPPPGFAALAPSLDGEKTRKEEACGDVSAKRRLNHSLGAGPEPSARWAFEADLERLWQHKTDLHGIGYGTGGPHSHMEETHIPKQRRLYLSDKRYNRARDFSDYGAFGTGVFDMEEYDVWEDIYNKGNRSSLCNEEVQVTSQESGDPELPAPPRTPPHSSPAQAQRGCLPGFAPAQQPDEAWPDVTKWEAPPVPRSFRGVHHCCLPSSCVEEAEESSVEHRKLLEFLREHGDRRLMDPTSRAEMLGERTRAAANETGMQPPAQAESVARVSADGPLWRATSEEQRGQLLQNLGRHFVVGRDQDMDGCLGQREPFKSDPQKQQRYAAFCAAMDGGASMQDAGRTSSAESEAELLEFGRVRSMFLVQTPGVDVVPGPGPALAGGEKQLPSVRRVVQSWAATELLCKRWGVPHSRPQVECIQEMEPHKPQQAAVSASIKESLPEPGVEPVLPQRPPSSLFAAIFGTGALSDSDN